MVKSVKKNYDLRPIEPTQKGLSRRYKQALLRDIVRAKSLTAALKDSIEMAKISGRLMSYEELEVSYRAYLSELLPSADFVSIVSEADMSWFTSTEAAQDCISRREVSGVPIYPGRQTEKYNWVGLLLFWFFFSVVVVMVTLALVYSR